MYDNGIFKFFLTLLLVVVSGVGIACAVAFVAGGGMFVTDLMVPLNGCKEGSDVLEVNHQRLFATLAHGNITDAIHRDLAFNEDCYHISEVDVVGASNGPGCNAWCADYLGNKYNMKCALLDGAAVINVCFKARVAETFAEWITPTRMFGIVVLYALGSGLLG
jgi:hypothetical protein